ncbi:MAG: hypothetical protein JSR59_21350 [Proteobacteria bacterium]|nr:hypothetical protein [Pseudomonadota bacterium]
MKPSNTIRLICLLAAVVMAGLVVGSQFGMANHYALQGDETPTLSHPLAIAQSASAVPRRAAI